MANAAVFMLIANDGRADQMIMATSLLHARIDDVRAIRTEQGMDDINPTLADIERTHLLFMNATFKPFAAFGFEYQKVQPTGAITWGSTLKYSIPQAGDFFADIGVRFACNAISGGAAATINPANDGTTIIGPGGETISAGAVATAFPAVRWCDFPGERAVTLGKFTVNSNTLHEYSQHATAFWRKYELPPGKEKSYARLVGQEVPLEGYSSVRNLMSQADGTITDGLGLTGTTARVHRQVRSIVNGLQTPKLKHAATSFWHKCMFWFNRDPRLMVPSVSIPYGQRFVELTLATQAQMCGAIRTDRAWSLTPSMSAQAPAELDLFTAAGSVTTATTSALDTTNNGAVTSADMYVNNVYVLPDIHDIYIHRIGFNLIRVTREDTKDLLASASNVQLHNLKWPIESIYFGCQPTGQENDLAHWWRMGQQTRNASFQTASKAVLQDGANVTIAANAYGDVVGTSTWPNADVTVTIINGVARIPVASNNAPAVTLPVCLPLNADGTFTVPVGCITTAAGVVYPDTAVTYTPGAAAAESAAQLQSSVAGLDHFRTCVDTLDDVTISLHGTKVYDAMPSSFFSDYMPTTFGCGRVVGTEDCGSHAVFFGLYPGTYQPSGHVNISRARELYFATTPTTAGKLIHVATAINFLLISDGNAILRYTT